MTKFAEYYELGVLYKGNSIKGSSKSCRVHNNFNESIHGSTLQRTGSGLAVNDLKRGWRLDSLLKSKAVVYSLHCNVTFTTLLDILAGRKSAQCFFFNHSNGKQFPYVIWQYIMLSCMAGDQRHRSNQRSGEGVRYVFTVAR